MLSIHNVVGGALCYILNRMRGVNPLKPKDLKKRRTAQLTSRCCIFYIYSTNIRTEYFKHAA
jgi:hypothetical protein